MPIEVKTIVSEVETYNKVVSVFTTWLVSVSSQDPPIIFSSFIVYRKP